MVVLSGSTWLMQVFDTLHVLWYNFLSPFIIVIVSVLFLSLSVLIIISYYNDTYIYVYHLQLAMFLSNYTIGIATLPHGVRTSKYSFISLYYILYMIYYTVLYNAMVILLYAVLVVYFC